MWILFIYLFPRQFHLVRNLIKLLLPARRVVPVTASTNKSRMITYIGAGDVELSPADIAAIDKAGLASATYMERKRKAIRAAKFVLVLGFIAVVGGRLLL